MVRDDRPVYSQPVLHDIHNNIPDDAVHLVIEIR